LYPNETCHGSQWNVYVEGDVAEVRGVHKIGIGPWRGAAPRFGRPSTPPWLLVYPLGLWISRSADAGSRGLPKPRVGVPVGPGRMDAKLF